jgi:ATP-dependent Clp protease ATP-binding subunit ClpX
MLERLRTLAAVRTRRLRCSFCGKPEESARKLIAGPRVFICDACVGLCVDILRQDARREADTAPPPSH